MLARLREYGNELTLRNLLTQESRESNLRRLKRCRLGDKYDVVVNRSLLSETTSSLSKRRSASRQAGRDLPVLERQAQTRLSERARYVSLKKVYRDL